MRHKKNRGPTEEALRIGCAPPDPSDPQGSYTGRPADPRETPQQDADDL